MPLQKLAKRRLYEKAIPSHQHTGGHRLLTDRPYGIRSDSYVQEWCHFTDKRNSKVMKKPNAGQVYYFITRSIASRVNEDQLNNCQILIDNACFYNYAFADILANILLIRRCELIANIYPVHE